MNSLAAGFFMANARGPLSISQRVILVCALGICCTFLCAEARGQDSHDMRQRFLNEAPPAWEKFRGRAKRLQGSFSVKTVLAGRVVAHEKSDLKQTQGCALLLEQSLLAHD